MVKKGIKASTGIAIAKAFLYQKSEIQIEKKSAEPLIEKERLKEALLSAKKQLCVIYKKVLSEMGEEDAAIFEAHSLILEDPELISGIEFVIDDEQCNAEWAVQQTIENYASMFEGMDDSYFAARAADMRDVGNRILCNLTGTKHIDLSYLDEDVIIIAEDLVPSDTAQMDKKHVCGIVTNMGSYTSHTAIMARNLEIPAVLGLGDITEHVNSGEWMVVNGNSGEVIIKPDETIRRKYEKKKKNDENQKKELLVLNNLPAETIDGYRVQLVGNIGNPNDAKAVLDHGGKGVGLYRTEFLYMTCDAMPDEEKQFHAYRQVAESFPKGGIIIRTMDIGGDKKLPYLHMEEEMNPFLGLRAIRLSFAREDLFRTQLRAICRASAFGKVRVMFPMISSIQELRQAKTMMQEVMSDLKREGIAYDPDMSIGMMVEIPSAAITADLLVNEADFFSIGTNDLCQYTLAVDRMNQNVAYLYNPMHPALLRMIKMVIDASNQKANCFTGMCGEMAGDPVAAVILLGLGIKEFSMSAASIPKVKKIIRSVSMEQAKKIAEKALKMETGEEITTMVIDELTKFGLNHFL